MKDNAVIIYAKWPEVGRCKTRIARDTGNEFAYEFSKACLDDLVSHLVGSDYYDLLVGVNSDDELGQFNSKYGLGGIITEAPDDLDKLAAQSKRFDNIFSALLKDYKKAILIPMDLPFLTEEDMISSFARMDNSAYVHGPEHNGGMYLVGVKAPYERDIFDGIRWSTSRSFKDLVNNCNDKSVYELKHRADLNIFEDVLQARRGIAHHCKNLFTLLVQNGYYHQDEKRYVDYDKLNINIPVTTAIVQRDGGKEILVQTRYKLNVDPENTGKLEVPNGLIDRYEPAYIAAAREVKEETGLDVTVCGLNGGPRYKDDKNSVEIYEPFATVQQTHGGRAYISMAFICNVTGGNLQENIYETRNPHWMPTDEMEDIISTQPDRIFPLNIPPLQRFIDMIKNQ